MEYLIDDIFPTGELHLISGPSGSGKTTWLLQMIQDWRAGKPVFGHASHPTKFVFIACDRSAKNIRKTMQRVGIDPATIPLVSLIDERIGYDFNALVKLLSERYPDAETYFIDGFASLMPEGRLNDYGAVQEFLTMIARACDKTGHTIFGVLHATKVKEKEKFSNPRQRILGSVAWAAYSETVVVIEPDNPENPEDNTRTLYLLPRNHAESTHQYTLDDNGRLIPVDTVEGCDKLRLFTETYSFKTQFHFKAIEEHATSSGVPRSTMVRWLKKQVTDGTLFKPSKGYYQRKMKA